MSKRNSTNIPDWLKNLQENSWEMELLISGGAIFSLFQFSELYLNWAQELSTLSIIPGAGLLIIIGMFGIKILTLGFIIHLAVRAFWLALVCINAAFPQGINSTKIKQVEPFSSQKFNDYSLKRQIEKIDDSSGTIFYITIIAATVILGIIIPFGLILTIVSLPTNIFPLIDKIDIYIVFAFLIYLLDLLFFGSFRKIPYLSYLLFPIFKLFDLITFRNLYQKSLNLFSSNVKKISFFIKVTFFAFVAFTITYLDLYKQYHWPNFFDQREYRWQLADEPISNEIQYMDNWEKDKLNAKVAITSKFIRGNYLELFVRYNRIYDRVIDQTNPDKNERLFSKIFELFIDHKALRNTDWVHTVKSNGLIGITAVIPIHSLNQGKHIIQLKLKEEYKEMDYVLEIGNDIKGIPFWIDRNIPNPSTQTNKNDSSLNFN